MDFYDQYAQPLPAYHNQLRIGAASGYPNQQMMSPHPYAMAMASQRRPANRYPFAYNTGRKMRLYMNQSNRLSGRYYSPLRNNNARSWGTPHQRHRPGEINYISSNVYANGQQPNPLLRNYP